MVYNREKPATASAASLRRRLIPPLRHAYFCKAVVLRPPQDAQAPSHFHGVGKTRRSRQSLAGNAEGRAMIGTGADKRQAERNIHRLVKIHRLQRGQALVVVERHHDIVFAPQRPGKNRVARLAG